MTSILIMLGTGAEKVHGLKCLTVYVTWWGFCYCIELFNVQLLQTDPVGCVWPYQPFWVIRARMRCTFLATTYLWVLHKELFFSFIPVNDHLNWHTIWVKPACSLANCTGTSSVSVQSLAYSLNPCSVIIDTS